MPTEALDATRDAVFEAGGGRIGEYERCSWYTAGTGTFLGGDETDPTVGERGREEHVPELRVETVVPDGARRRRGRRAPRRASVRGARLRRLPAARRVKATLYTDGGSRGNPGPAAYAYVLETEDGTVLDARGETIGVATNNVAEYRALVEGLEAAAARGGRRARGRLRLRAPRQADARRVQGQERGAAGASLEAARIAREVGR